MKAIRTHEQTGIGGLVLEEAPDPKPNFCEVLVRVAACGITHNELDWPTALGDIDGRSSRRLSQVTLDNSGRAVDRLREHLSHDMTRLSSFSEPFSIFVYDAAEKDWATAPG